MERTNLDQCDLNGAAVTAVAASREWAWQQAITIFGANWDVVDGQEKAEKFAQRLADFVQTGTFAVS